MTKYNVFLYLSFSLLGILLHLIIKFTHTSYARIVMTPFFRFNVINAWGM